MSSGPGNREARQDLPRLSARRRHRDEAFLPRKCLPEKRDTRTAPAVRRRIQSYRRGSVPQGRNNFQLCTLHFQLNCPPPRKNRVFAQLSQTGRCAAKNPRAVADIAEMCFIAAIKQTFSKCPTRYYHTPCNAVKRIAILYSHQFFAEIGNRLSRRGFHRSATEQTGDAYARSTTWLSMRQWRSGARSQGT